MMKMQENLHVLDLKESVDFENYSFWAWNMQKLMKLQTLVLLLFSSPATQPLNYMPFWPLNISNTFYTSVLLHMLVYLSLEIPSPLSLNKIVLILQSIDQMCLTWEVSLPTPPPFYHQNQSFPVVATEYDVTYVTGSKYCLCY